MFKIEKNQPKVTSFNWTKSLVLTAVGLLTSSCGGDLDDKDFSEHIGPAEIPKPEAVKGHSKLDIDARKIIKVIDLIDKNTSGDIEEDSYLYNNPKTLKKVQDAFLQLKESLYEKFKDSSDKEKESLAALLVKTDTVMRLLALHDLHGDVFEDGKNESIGFSSTMAPAYELRTLLELYAKGH